MYFVDWSTEILNTSVLMVKLYRKIMSFDVSIVSVCYRGIYTEEMLHSKSCSCLFYRRTCTMICFSTTSRRTAGLNQRSPTLPRHAALTRYSHSEGHHTMKQCSVFCTVERSRRQKSNTYSSICPSACELLILYYVSTASK